MCSRFRKEIFHAKAQSKAAKAQIRIPLCVFAGLPLRLCVKLLLQPRQRKTKLRSTPFFRIEFDMPAVLLDNFTHER